MTDRLVFDLPATYLFRPILTVTVHWVLELADGKKIRISTRFRR